MTASAEEATPPAAAADPPAPRGIRRRWVAWLLAALGLAAAVGALRLAEPRSVLDASRLEMTPAQLRERAREVIASTTGWAETEDDASGFEYAEDYLALLDRIPGLEERRALRRGSPPPVWFWYRQSSAQLAPAALDRLAHRGFDTPPLRRPGEIALRLDAQGRLVELRRWPRPAESRQREDAWEPVFTAAGMELSAFRELYPRFVTPVPADARFTWTGETMLFPGEEITADGGAVEGRPTFFRYAGTWGTRVPPPVHDLSTLPRGAFGLLVVFLVVLALRHRAAGLDDRRVGRNLALAAGVVAAIVLIESPATILRSLDPATSIELVGICLAFSAGAWLVATALGPRLALWPGVLSGWNLFWQGRWGQPLVAASTLVGACGGTALALLSGLAWWIPVWLGRTAIETRPPIGGLAGGWDVVEAIATALARGAMWTALSALLLELSRAVLRVRLVAAGATAAALLVLHAAGSPLGWVVMAIHAALWVAVLVRWGLLAALVAAWIDQLFALALVSDLGHWGAQTSWAVLAITTVLLVIGAAGALRPAPRLAAGDGARGD